MIDFEKRLKSLKERRQGTRESAIYESMESFSASNAILDGVEVRKSESFENLKEAAGVKYAIGAMAAVEVQYTRVSIDEGNRVADSLIKSLSNYGVSVTKRLQGSVALDIHIKGHSDVDMLIIATNPVTYPRTLVDIAKDVRSKSEKILPLNFPKATVDCTGNKSIVIVGPSLKRKIDIVPATWFDTIKYKQSKQECDRGINIYHKADHNLLLNYPFTHIKMINERDNQYSGNLKCVIRLMKNVIADMPEGKKLAAKKLSSYDLAAIAFHMNTRLNVPQYMRLSLVEKTREYLTLLNSEKTYRDTLDVPDGSRKIFDADEKAKALKILTNEITDLTTAIFKELQPYRVGYDSNVILNKSIYLPLMQP